MKKAVWDVKTDTSVTKDHDVFDTMLAEFLLSYGKSPLVQDAVMASYDVLSLEELAIKQQAKLVALPHLKKLYEEIELPLAFVLRHMEQKGISLDINRLRAVGEELDGEIASLSRELEALMGDINLNSSVQVGTYLAEKEGVPLAKTKTGRFATNEQELSKHAEQFPIIHTLLHYRELMKLRSTYVESLITKADESGRVHTTYHQAAVSTGRLASSNPNMQNIPVTSEFGLKIKSCFTASEGNTLLSFDYSQQELRILAHLTGEENLIDAFNNGRDVHKITASNLFSVPYEEVSKQQRSAAKTINFGIIYGMSSFGLSVSLRIPVEEAQAFIDTFYASYPRIRAYYDTYLSEGKKNGFVETILGRRRNTFDYPGQKFIDNSQRRVLINYPIQGSAADLMKRAMVLIDGDVMPEYPEARMLLQIHDDLVFEILDDRDVIARFTDAVRKIMCTVYPLSVPIEVDVKIGQRWGELTPYR